MLTVNEYLNLNESFICDWHAGCESKQDPNLAVVWQGLRRSMDYTTDSGFKVTFLRGKPHLELRCFFIFADS